MPHMREIKRKIRSVRSTQQITRAMKMVAAAKLRRAQARLWRFRPYSDMIGRLLTEFLPQTSRNEHPLLVERPEKKIVMAVITGDRGLCGGFNMNVVRRFVDVLEGDFADRDVQTIGIGGRGNHWLKKQGITLQEEHTDIYDRLNSTTVTAITDELIEHYKVQEIDALYIIYNHFITVMTQEVRCAKVLPLDLDAISKRYCPEGEEPTMELEYEFEPPIEQLTDHLISRFVATELFRALAESVASEFAARMTAMDAASHNADELIHDLTLMYNRARQAGITKEITEIVGGAEAMAS